MHSALKVGSRFCMNLLGEDQSEVSAACGGARAAVERFSVGQWARNGEGVPYVEGAQSNLFCEVVQIVDCGTHAIIIGQVDAVEVTPDRAPLVYFDGRYVRVESHAA
jgi:flavin reductase (DIM6/NTAB) family NADH-FMN oxidoreductase RutF